jgi:hypothetical protein
MAADNATAHFPLRGGNSRYEGKSDLRLGDAMTCHCSIVAIYHQAQRLSPEEIAPLEKAAFEGLGANLKSTGAVENLIK